MNAQRLIGLILVLVIVVAAFVHGSMPMSAGFQLALHGWWIIAKVALPLFAACVLLVRRVRGALRPVASEAGVAGRREEERTARR